MDHTTREGDRNQLGHNRDHPQELPLASGPVRFGDTRAFRQLQEQVTHSQSKGEELAATMAAIRADLKLEMSPLPGWNSDLTGQMQENFANFRTRPREPSPRHEQVDISSFMRPPRCSIEGIQSHSKNAGAFGSMQIAQQQADIGQLQHQVRPAITGIMNFDSGLQSIASIVGGSMDQWDNGVNPRSEKRQRISSSSPSQSFHTPDGLTTIKDSLPGNPGGRRDGVPQLQASGSAGPQRGVNVQGINEMLQRFNPAPSNMTIKQGTPFDSLGFAEIGSPHFENLMLFPENEKHGRGLEGGWPLQGLSGKALSSLSVKTWSNLGAAHDANTMEQLLIHCAQALENNDVTLAQQIMWVLNNIAAADGDPNQRVTACFLKALVRRAGRMVPLSFNGMYGEERESKVVSAVEYAVMIDITPWYRFGFKAANGVMMEAFEGKDKVHIIDFSTTYGMQWPTLIESLSERPEGPPRVRLTVHKARPNIPPFLGMAEEDVAKKLISFASNRNVDLEVHIVHHEIEQLERSMFDIREDETNVVNVMYRARYVPDESADPPACSRDTFLRFVHSLDPALVIMVDEEATITSTNLVNRVKAAFNYIWIPFDALDTFLPRDSTQRLEYELDLEKKIENIVACEGLQRIERIEAKDRWGQRMKKVGFESVPFSEDVNSEVKSMLSDHAAGWGMKHDDDAMLLTWKGHNVLFATAWQPFQLSSS